MEDISKRGVQTNDKERIGTPIGVNFYKLGGTWDMIFRADGAKIGIGSLDDDKLKEIQEELGIFTRDPIKRQEAERKLVLYLAKRFEDSSSESVDAAQHLSSWAKNVKGESFGDFVAGTFTPLFSGDSSHLRGPIVAPMIAFLIKKAIEDPTKPILGGQGTDTADIALLSLYDVLTFDTKLPPLMLSGANRSHNEQNSDAPENFIDLAKIATLDMGSGSYWIFQGNIYKGSDFVKIDPEETRQIENQSTFFATHGTNQSVDRLMYIQDKLKADFKLNVPPSKDHVTYKVTAEKLYDACEAVYTDDLGNQNSTAKLMDIVGDPQIKAIVIGAHSLGNVDNESRYDLVQAAKDGKLVIDASRTLIGNVSGEYAASLMYANNDRKELGGTGRQIINAHKLSKAVARAVVVRAILDGLDQEQTQALLDDYARSRKLI